MGVPTAGRMVYGVEYGSDTCHHYRPCRRTPERTPRLDTLRHQISTLGDELPIPSPTDGNQRPVRRRGSPARHSEHALGQARGTARPHRRLGRRPRTSIRGTRIRGTRNSTCRRRLTVAGPRRLRPGQRSSEFHGLHLTRRHPLAPSRSPVFGCLLATRSGDRRIGAA